MRHSIDFSVVIVNWNTSALLKQCLQSVYAFETLSSFEVIVVDNASSDDSCAMVKATFPQVRLIENETNVGFARANNQGILQSYGASIILLNSDTVLLNNIFAELDATFAANDTIGIIGTALITPDNQPQRLARGKFLNLHTALNHYLFLSTLFPRHDFFAGWSDHTDYDTVTRVDWVSGACLAIRRNTLGHIGLLDEAYFMYAEDMELCYRARQAGYQVVYQPRARVQHFMGQSMKKQTSKYVLKAPLMGMDSYYQRCYGRKHLLLFRTIVSAGMLLRLLMRQIDVLVRGGDERRHRLVTAKHYAQTALWLWKNTPTL